MLPKRPFFSKFSLVLASGLMTIAPTVPAWGASQPAVLQGNQEAPIVQALPADGATTVRPDAAIQFVLDPNDPHYQQFVSKFQHGKYTITLNDQQVPGSLDLTTHTLTLRNQTLNRYTTYHVALNLSNANGNDNKVTTEYAFSFTTGSALHEATHLTTNVEQPAVSVITGGKMDVQVTDDYGLPANNATVQVTGDSSSFQTVTLNLTSADQGGGVLPLIDHVKQSVDLTVTSTDNSNQDAVDKQVAAGSEQFLPGPADHLSAHADSPLTVGQGEPLTGTVFDLYNNTVADSTLVFATATNGTITPSEENTTDGAFDFTFTAPTKVQEVVLSAQSGSAQGQVTVDLQPDQPANLALTPAAAQVKAGESDDVQVVVTDQYGNPIPNAQLSVAGSGNSEVSGTVTTDQDGMAMVPFRDTKAESVTVTATAANGVQGTAQIAVQAGDPANLTLTPDTTSVTAGTPDNVQAVVTDEYGNPVPNVPLTVTGTGSSTVAGSVTTDDNGTAVIPVSDPKAESVTVTAMTANGVQGSAQVTIQPGDPAQVIVQADKTQIAADGKSTATATVTVVDAYGNPVPGAALTLTSTGHAQFPATVTTNGQGQATFAITDSTAETVSILVAAEDNAAATLTLQSQTVAPYVANLIPTLYYDQSPLGVASASSEMTRQAYYGFNGALWKASNTTSGWLAYDFQEAAVVQSYSITADTVSDSPASWTFEGFDGSNWVVLDTQTTYTNWTNGQTNTFAVANPGSYTQYRINVSATNGTAASGLGIGKLTMGGYYPAPTVAPLGLDYINANQREVLTWHEMNGATGYNIYLDGVKVNSTPFTPTSSTFTYTINGLVNGKIYHLSVSAVNKMGESPQTTPVLVMPFATGLIPTMYNSLEPDGVTSASSEPPVNPSYYAFDGNPSTHWKITSNTGWIAYDFQEPAVVQEYAVGCDVATDAPSTWTFEGFDGSSWVVLDSQSGINNWSAYKTNYFTITNTQAYQKYRLNVTGTSGNAMYGLAVSSLQMAGYYLAPTTAPTGLRNTQNGNSQVTLYWNTINGATGYNIYQDGVKMNSTPVSPNAIPYTLTGLTNGEVHQYTVTGVNAMGESPQSASVLAMPYTTNLIPTMTSDRAPSGIASASWETNPAYYAFDNKTTTAWKSTNTKVGWLTYDFQKPTVVQEYTITPDTGTDSPYTWTFDGWDGSKWVVLDSHTTYIYFSSGTNYFTIPNTQAYTKYRLNIISSAYSGVGIASLMMEGTQN